MAHFNESRREMVAINIFPDNVKYLSFTKPIRGLQLIMISSLFALNIYTIAKNSPYGPVEGTMLSFAFGSFFFVILIDIISQFAGQPIPNTPMFLFGVVGSILFLLASGAIFFVARKSETKNVWRLIVSIALSTTCSFLFLLDILLIILYGYK